MSNEPRSLWCAVAVCAAAALSGCASGPRMSMGMNRHPSGKSPVVAHSRRAPSVVTGQFYAARNLERAGQLAEARQAYLELYSKDPRNGMYVHRLAVVCTRLNDHVAADEYYRRALQLLPRDPALMADAGYASYLRKDYVRAEDLLRKSLAMDPQNALTVNNLGLVLGMSGEFDQALAMFQRTSTPAAAQSTLAYVHQRRGEWKQALACYEAAHALDSSVQIPATLLARLEQPAAPAEEAFAAAEPTVMEGLQTAAVEDATAVANDAITASEEQFSPFAEVEATAEAVVAEAEATVTEETPVEIAEQVPALVSADEVIEANPIHSEQPVITPGGPAPTEDLAWADVSTYPEEPGVDRSSTEWLSQQREAIASRAGAEGFKGFCPVALRDELKLVDASSVHTADYRSQVYRFCSAEAAQKFLSNPERYMPAAGGLDVVAVRNAEAVSTGSLDAAVWFRSKLYLFTNRQNLEQFRLNPREYLQQQ